MKIKKRKRTIRPKPGSKAKQRPGIIEIVEYIPESNKELNHLLSLAAPQPLAELRAIIERAEQQLKNVPRDELGIPQTDAASPESYALSAKLFAESAIARIEQKEIMLAVRDAMGASRAEAMMWFTYNWEPITARAIKQTPAPPKEKRKQWAVLLADELIEQGYNSFPDAWDSISEDDDRRYDGLEVYRDGDNLIAEKSGQKDKLPKQSFRTGYYQRQKNQK